MSQKRKVKPDRDPPSPTEEQVGELCDDDLDDLPEGVSCPVFPAKTCQTGQEGATEAPSGLTARQERAIEALMREPTVTRAATVSGVGERTLRRWLTEPPFHAAVLAARREAYGQAVGLMQRYAPVAVATLVKVMQDAAASPGAKVSAAMVVLRVGREGIELDDLSERVAALEQQMAGPKTLITQQLREPQ